MPHPQVVRVYATVQEPDYDCPWQSTRPSACTGSGVLIGPSEILTGAHVVANATFLQVQRIHDPEKMVARVKAVCHDCDLALLKVDDPNFMKGIEPAEVGQLPALRDKVQVIGFPVGGEEISITEGVVSRIELQRYHHSQRHLLAVTVDAAINEGSSGGPVFKGDKIIGIAFQKLDDADNIGEMVPAPIIKTFLRVIEHTPRPHMPGLGLQVQTLENPLLRQRLGLSPRMSGVLVRAVEYCGSAWGKINPRDALLEIAGHPIANSGTIFYNGKLRTRLDAVLGHHQVGDLIEVTVLRNGRRRRVKLLLQPNQPLVPRNRYDRLPTYFIYGGLVFQPLTRDYLSTWSGWREEAPPELLQLYYSGMRTEERQEIIVLNQVLSDEINVGYTDLDFEWIARINGHQPRDMVDLVRRVDLAEGVLEIETSSGSLIMLDSVAVKARTAQILERYHVPSDRSSDLPLAIERVITPKGTRAKTA